MSKHILQIAPTPFFADRGCHIRIEGIVRCLAELGFSNTVCTYHHGRDVANVKTKRISNIESYTQTAAGPSKYKLWADWKLLWLATRQYRELQPAVIHAHLHEGLLIGLIIKYMFFWRRTPIIADIQGSLSGELDSHGSFDKRPYLRWPTRQIERFLLWAVDYIVCSSTHSLNKIRDEFHIKPEKISLVQDGADLPTPLTESESLQLKIDLKIPSNKTLVVYSGALLNAKGLDELKQLVTGCRSIKDAIHFLIIGYPTDNLTDFLTDKKLTDLCTLTGQIEFEKLPQYLSLADIAIDPKHSNAGEGSGKILNYMACGLPIVAFDGDNNRLFLPTESKLANNVSELLDLLLEFHSDTSLRQSTAKANFKQFKTLYSWQTTQRQLSNVYQRVLS